MNEMPENAPSAEHALISRLHRILGTFENDHYRTGIGDDAAVRDGDGRDLVLTTDLSVEGVHFSREYMSMEEIGYRSMVSNVSDCAAMGAIPDGALIQLVIPEQNIDGNEAVEALYRGFREACDRWHFPVIGGDLSRGKQWVIGISLIGRVEEKRTLLRSGMHPGDGIWLTGCPGRSAAGLFCLETLQRKIAEERWPELVAAHLRPIPRVAVGRYFAATDGIHAAMDLSDGISKDCRTMCHESGYGIILSFDSSQVPDAMIQLSRDSGIPWRKWFLHGGEDYELLFAADKHFDPEACRMIDPEVRCIRIGTCTDTVNDVMITTDDGIEPLPPGAYDHMK